MRTTLIIPDKLIRDVMKVSGVKTKTGAVILSLREYLRRKEVEQLIAMSGNLRFPGGWEKLRHDR